MKMKTTSIEHSGATYVFQKDDEGFIVEPFVVTGNGSVLDSVSSYDEAIKIQRDFLLNPENGEFACAVIEKEQVEWSAYFGCDDDFSPLTSSYEVSQISYLPSFDSVNDAFNFLKVLHQSSLFGIDDQKLAERHTFLNYLRSTTTLNS